MEISKLIKEAIQHNKLVLFVGSGVSTKIDLPTWGKLVNDIIHDLDSPKYKPLLPVLEGDLMTPMEVIDKLVDEHTEIKRYIKKNFSVNKDKDLTLHKKLLDLTNYIITTNYDNAFELASGNTITPTTNTSQFNVSEINKSDNPYIFKIHGDFSESDNCIIFKKDYEKLYNTTSPAVEKLKSIFAEKTILFVGFGFNDPDINLVFDNLDKLFDNNNRHFVLTTQPDLFKNFKFLSPIKLNTYDEIDEYINHCLNFKNDVNPVNIKSLNIEPDKKEVIFRQPKIAYLVPNPIDIDLGASLSKIIDCFDNLKIKFHYGTLNIKSLELIDDYDLLIIATSTYKSKLYIEDDNLKSNLITANEICDSIPNDQIPIIFITDTLVEIPKYYKTINFGSLKMSEIKRFIFKTFREEKFNFTNFDDVSVNLSDIGGIKFEKGKLEITSLYGNNKNLDIGRKSLSSVIGRIEEQSTIAQKLINILKTGKLLNIKASGGTGKTTIVKKVAYELYNRGYYKNGVSFVSCENLKNYEDFEELLIQAFQLSNILDFKNYLTENYPLNKKDLLIILDNFETVTSTFEQTEIQRTLDLLRFSSDFVSLVTTSREKILYTDDFEDVFSLTPLITDDALILFQKFYGKVENESEIRILRQEILEDLLNNNPLAIKLVTKSRTRSSHISELKDLIKQHFFESINEDYNITFKSNADLNIERSKSIYQSVNYSYTTLTEKERIAFELLSLFPDGISLSNFKNCFEKKISSNKISDKELRVLRDKSLVEDYNGTLQLQPIIRRFADFQFSKRPKKVREKYCSDAYIFNCFILQIIDIVENKNSYSAALKIYNHYKNNLLNVFNYMPDVEITEDGKVSDKKYLLNYINSLQYFIVSKKQIAEFHESLDLIRDYFSDLAYADEFIETLGNHKSYYFKEFDLSYKRMCKILSVEDMEKRIFQNEDYIESRMKHTISHIHGMEGYTVQEVSSYVLNNDYSRYLDNRLFYLGIDGQVDGAATNFYKFELKIIQNKVDLTEIEDYIESLHTEEHLERMQCTYVLSKLKTIDTKRIKKLVVTNPYTKGLKELMLAFISTDENKVQHFEKALENLIHIKYYYLEGLYYYCLFLKEANPDAYAKRVKQGIELTNKFHYQYLNHLFSNIDNNSKNKYEFSYEYYPIEGLEEYVDKHNESWKKYFQELAEKKV
jgi:NAD-dependent SIR2 family protein deacetylase